MPLMMRPSLDVTGVERRFADDEIIVSKTDLKGRITYANRVFVAISGYSESELLGAPHSILRHPEMPRAVFKLLWDTIQGGREIFAYVLNRCKSGDHYWVFAHVTPSYDRAGNVCGFHSNRRSPEPAKVARVEPIYQQLLSVERRHSNPKEQIAASVPALHRFLEARGMSYDEFIFSL